MSIKEKWNKRYRDEAGEEKASRVLRENLHLLPANGLALDLACGLGGNAILLAQQGLSVCAWDIADVGEAVALTERGVDFIAPPATIWDSDDAFTVLREMDAAIGSIRREA